MNLIHGSSRGRVARYNIAMHRVAMLRPVASCTRSEMYRTQWHNHLTMHCQSVLRPELWVGYSSSLHGRGQALSGRGCCACNHSRAEISPFDLLVGDAVCMSAGRPSFDSSHDDADNMCSRAAVPTTLANSIGNCSALRSKSIWLAMLGALSVDSASQ
jgi:hypothetical protein